MSDILISYSRPTELLAKAVGDQLREAGTRRDATTNFPMTVPTAMLSKHDCRQQRWW